MALIPSAAKGQAVKFCDKLDADDSIKRELKSSLLQGLKSGGWGDDKIASLKSLVNEEFWSEIESAGWFSKTRYYACADLNKNIFPEKCDFAVKKYLSALSGFTRRTLSQDFVSKILEPSLKCKWKPRPARYYMAID